MNSWMIDQVRHYSSHQMQKRYYHGRILSKVFAQAKSTDIGQPLTVRFVDNHFSNVESLDYQKLHRTLSKFFNPVTFASDNLMDVKLAPDYFVHSYFEEGLLIHLAWIDLTIKHSTPVNCLPKPKMFGLHILRPDWHRFGILIELYRRNLLEHTDVRIGFDRSALLSQDYWRSSNIDLACKDFDIGHQELLSLIDSLPHGERADFGDNNTHKGYALSLMDFAKNQFNHNFAIELVCASSVADNVFHVGSEKLCRPMLMKQPWIQIGPAGSYQCLKLWGFETFGQFWDESWESFPADMMSHKITEIGAACDHIVKTYSTDQVVTMCQPILEHNYKTLVDIIEYVRPGPNFEENNYNFLRPVVDNYKSER